MQGHHRVSVGCKAQLSVQCLTCLLSCDACFA